MIFYSDISNIPEIPNTIVTVGNFDGVHLGHKAIIDKMLEIKKKTNGNIVVLTFNPHPQNVLKKNNDFKYIHFIGRKSNIFARIGVDYLINIPFTAEFAKLSTEYFIEHYLVNILHAKYIVVGYDCHFGISHEETITVLSDLCAKHKFEFIEIPPVYIKDKIISSSAIREYLRQGMIKEANRMLGYEYSIFGQVVYGHHLGRTIGFPTANIIIENDLKLIAAEGVYVCYIKWNKNMFFGICNIGTRPTLNGKDLTIEVNIFDFNEDIYGEFLGIYFIDKLRDEQKFDSLDSLKAQISVDAERAKEIIESMPQYHF